MRGGIVCWVRWRRKASQECVERFSDVFRFLSAFFERLCYRKWLMLFSLKLQRDNRKNALTVDPAKWKTGKKLYFSPHCGDETNTYLQSLLKSPIIAVC